jgi:hypothetical protein
MHAALNFPAEQASDVAAGDEGFLVTGKAQHFYAEAFFGG